MSRSPLVISEEKEYHHDMKEKIEQCLELIRPRLAMHKGNVEFVRFEPETGVVFVRFLGGCKGCPLSQITLKMLIEHVMNEWVPEVKEVVAVEEEKNNV